METSQKVSKMHMKTTSWDSHSNLKRSGKGCSFFSSFSLCLATCFSLVKFQNYFCDLARVEKKQRFTKFDISDLKVMIHVSFNNVLLYAILILFEYINQSMINNKCKYTDTSRDFIDCNVFFIKPTETLQFYLVHVSYMKVILAKLL